MFRELQSIQLLHDIPDRMLVQGTRGTIVDIYNEGEAYEVEFITSDGKESILLTLLPEDILPVIDGEIYLSSQLTYPVYLSTATISGTTVISSINKSEINMYRSNLGIKIQIPKENTQTEEFYYQSATI